MSAPGGDTFAEERDEMEEMDDAGSDDDDREEMEEEGAGEDAEEKVYVPGIEPLRPGEELEMDRSAYRMYHECQTGELNFTATVTCCLPGGMCPLMSSPCVLPSRGSVPELRHPEGWSWRRQGAVSSVHAALCRHTGRHSPEQQVGTEWFQNIPQLVVYYILLSFVIS